MNAYTMANEQITAYETSLRMEERREGTVQKCRRGSGAVSSYFSTASVSVGGISAETVSSRANPASFMRR